jgi:uncharacterized membrane protein YoaK (UPF0700 family)
LKLNIKEEQMSQSALLGLFLASSGGFLDAYTYLLRGGKFATMQTGNMIMFAYKIFASEPIAACYYLIPIASFFVAIVIAVLLEKALKTVTKFHWRQLIVFLEMLIVIGTAFVPVADNFNWLANMLVSFVAGLQLESFKKVKGIAFASTMCTGNLKSLAERVASFFTGFDKEKLLEALVFLAVILAFVGGVFVGYYSSAAYSNLGILFTLPFLFVSDLLMYIKPVEEKKPS